MCFGNQTTDTKNTTATPNAAVAAAATNNMTTAQNSLSGGGNNTFGQQYSGPLTAAISPGQQGTIDAATGIANNGTGNRAAGLINQYASAPAQSVSSDTIANNMSPYMNQYVMQALAPQLRQMDIANAGQNAATNATATGSGAFGDARAGIQASNDAFNQNVQREGVIGNAYNSAFNTAIGAGAQDVSNKLSAATTNANLGETALNRQMTGAQGLEGLQTQQLGAQTGANALNQQGTAANQAALTAQYNNWLQAQQSQIAGQQSANTSVLAGSQAMPASTTSTEQKPDNSGLAMLGGLVGAGLAPFTGGTSLAMMGPAMFGGGK